MPMIDMPLEQLQTYRGSSPRPADFDAYWDRALRELHELTGCYELEAEKDFSVTGAKFHHLWFPSIGGDKIHCRLSRPEHIEKPLPAVIFFHGYKGNCGDWYSHLPYVLGGMCCISMDVRGQGGLSVDTVEGNGPTVYGHIIRGIMDVNSDRMFYRSVYLDTAHVVRIVASLPFIDSKRIGVSGYSQGGALTLACAALSPDVSLAVPVYPFLCDFKRVWDLDLALDAYSELKSFFRTFDPLHEKEEYFWNRLGYLDLQYLSERITCKVVMITGLMDKICPPSTQFAAYNRISAPKEMLIYPDFGHEELPRSKEKIYQLMRAL